MATTGLTLVRGPQTAARKAAHGVGRTVLNVVLAVVAIVWLVPTVGLLITSLRSLSDSTSSGWWTVFTHAAGLTLDNYSKLLDTAGITRSLLNTVLIAVPATLLVVLLAALAAYAFAWMDFRGRTVLLISIIVLLAVPLQTAFIPLARLFGAIGIFGSIIGVILFHVAFGLPFAIFLLRNTFAQLPYEMIESARLDGANEWQVFARFVLPLGMPAVASLAIYQFLWTWNDMLVALIFSNSQSQPITVAIQSQLRAFSSNIDVLSSGAFLSMIVPLVIYFVFQKYFESAILAGSTK